MGFWIFMFIMNLMIPVLMIGFGKVFSQTAPTTINRIYGYRTNMSMKNEETWVFAHQYFGKIWYKLGWWTLVVTIVAMLFLFGKNEDVVGTIGGIICMIQMIPLLIPIFFTEKALKKEFDKDGKRKV